MPKNSETVMPPFAIRSASAAPQETTPCNPYCCARRHNLEDLRQTYFRFWICDLVDEMLAILIRLPSIENRKSKIQNQLNTLGNLCRQSFGNSISIASS